MKNLILIVAILLFSCKKNKGDFSFLKKYTSTELKYYLKTGFNDGRLQKWNKDLVVSFDKRFSSSFIERAQYFIYQIDSVIPGLNISVSDVNYNVKVFREEPKGGSYGLERTKYDFFNKCSINGSLIWLTPHASSSGMLLYFFCHEFNHTLGLNHAYEFKDEKALMGIKLFNDFDEMDSFYINFKIPPIDLKAIEIHYNENVWSGMRKEDFIKGLKGCNISITD